MENMRKLLRFLKPYWKGIVLIVALLTVQAISNLYLPNLNADIINNGVAKGDIQYILRTGSIMLIVTLLLTGSSVLSMYFGSRTSMAFGRDLRRDIFCKVEKFSQNEVDKFSIPSLVTRNTNDVHQIQMLILVGLNLIVIAPIMCIGGIIMAMRQDVVLSSSLIVVVPTIGIVVGLLLVKTVPLFRSMQVKIDKLNQVMREKLMGVRAIRAFVRNVHEGKRFDDANRDLTMTSLRVQRILAIGMPLLMVIMNLSSVTIIWFGAHRIDSGAMPIGNLTAFLTYILEILMSIMMAMVMFVMVPRAEAAAERINSVLTTEMSIKDPENPVELPKGDVELEFRNVEFSYPGAESPVLKNISFSGSTGETIAIIGSTGCGKSTLVNLIPRFYDITGGSVLINGVDIRKVTLEKLRDRIGLVPQRAYLFSGTVRSNLLYGKEDATDEELWHALEVAQAKHFVLEMPGQLNAPIDQGGINVSGGQRQRLAIARALVKHPDIYIFDDCFSALDFKTDANLRAALKGEATNALVIIVGQRVSTIMGADRIIVMNDNGTIAGAGTHSELMESCGVYREIVYSQLSKEEVA